jgi:hypothetical protein
MNKQAHIKDQENHPMPLTIGRSLLFLFVLILSISPAAGQSNGSDLEKPAGASMKLFQAVMCEDVKNQQPVNPTIVLSVSLGKATCFTSFESITGRTYVVHNWIRKDVSVTKVKLFLKPPLWSTYSRIHLREIDKGPWRVEIIDSGGNILKTLRFSITD